jgi:exopolyphosphatase/guanosine-5'-triphosphate,3'-diphosphate pyrophosphatase
MFRHAIERCVAFPGSGKQPPMRTAILDVGSNSAHVKIVDLAVGRPIRTFSSVKHPTRLAESFTPDGYIEQKAVGRVVSAVAAAVRVAEAAGATELIAFATSAIRDAANHRGVVAVVAAQTGVALGFLTGRDEARLTFLAARAWYGWSTGPLLLADIGGGSLEIAAGDGSEPDLALSMPLGAGRLTRDRLPGDPPRRKHVKRLRRHVADRLATDLTDQLPPHRAEQHTAALPGEPRQARAVATSKTFTQLAQLTQGTIDGDRRALYLEPLHMQITRLAKLNTSERARLQGISTARAHQILAGAIVAEQLMTALNLTRLEICPWALREGIALRRLQQLNAVSGQPDDIGHLLQPLGPSEEPPGR